MSGYDLDRLRRYWIEIQDARETLKHLSASAVSPDGELDSVRIRAMKYTIVVLVEAMSDLGRHLLAKKWRKIAEEYGEVFQQLRDLGVLSETLCEQLVGWVRLRNLLVHRYWSLDDRRLVEEVQAGLPEVGHFLQSIHRFLEGEGIQL